MKEDIVHFDQQLLGGWTRYHRSKIKLHVLMLKSTWLCGMDTVNFETLWLRDNLVPDCKALL